MSEHDDVQRLLSLKKYETPGEEYFEQFLSDFHDRQRTDILRKSSRSLFLERLSTWFSGFGREKWLLTGGICYAVVMLTLYLKPDEPELSPIRHVSDSVVLQDTASLNRVRLTPVSEVKPEKIRNGESGGGSSSKPGNASPFINLDELEILPLESGTFREF